MGGGSHLQLLPALVIEHHKAHFGFDGSVQLLQNRAEHFVKREILVADVINAINGFQFFDVLLQGVVVVPLDYRRIDVVFGGVEKLQVIGAEGAAASQQQRAQSLIAHNDGRGSQLQALRRIVC